MGYSCTAKASMVRDAVQALMDKHMPAEKSSNKMPDGGFWEIGREQSDGAITGTVWTPWSADRTRVTKRGSFKISADGKIERWPGLPKGMKEKAEAAGAKRYAETYEAPSGQGGAMFLVV